MQKFSAQFIIYDVRALSWTERVAVLMVTCQLLCILWLAVGNANPGCVHVEWLYFLGQSTLTNNFEVQCLHNTVKVN